MTAAAGTLVELVLMLEQEKCVSSSQSDLSALPPEKAATLQQHQQLKTSSGATDDRNDVWVKRPQTPSLRVCVCGCVWVFLDYVALNKCLVYANSLTS